MQHLASNYSNRIHYGWICRLKTTAVQLILWRNELPQLQNITEHSSGLKFVAIASMDESLAGVNLTLVIHVYFTNYVHLTGSSYPFNSPISRLYPCQAFSLYNIHMYVYTLSNYHNRGFRQLASLSIYWM